MNTNRLLILAFALAVTALPASAQMLYRCPGQGSNGATLIQDRPCPDGREAATQLDSREVRVSPQRQRQLAAQRARNERQPRQIHAVGGSQFRAPSEAQRRHQACENAKRSRDAQRRMLGLHRTYEALSVLDRNVRDACKGVR